MLPAPQTHLDFSKSPSHRPHFTILATPNGKWVFPDSDEFLAFLGDPDPDYDAAAFAVRNLGFIKLQFLPQIIEIEVHSRNVGFRGAFISACISMTSTMEVSSTTRRSHSSGLSLPRLNPPPFGSISSSR